MRGIRKQKGVQTLKTTYYDTCPFCGAHLDPGEHCDCREASNVFAAELYDKYYGKEAHDEQTPGR